MPDQELLFPVAGVDASGEANRPVPGTAAAAQNVRARDVFARRLRGGSRPGLTRLVAAPVDGTVGHRVQMLNVIVDPTVQATLAAFEDWTDDTGTPDPSTNNAAGGSADDPSTRNPGRLVRPGGSGVQPVRSRSGKRPVPTVVFDFFNLEPGG